MKKLLIILTTIIILASYFILMTTANEGENENLLAGKSYIWERHPEGLLPSPIGTAVDTNPPTLLTDEKKNKPEELPDIKGGIDGVTLQMTLGTNRPVYLIFDMEKAVNIDTVLFENVRQAGDRFCKPIAVEVSEDGILYTVVNALDVVHTPVNGAPKAVIDENLVDIYFDITAKFDSAEGVKFLRITLTTTEDLEDQLRAKALNGKGCFAALDEIKAFGDNNGSVLSYEETTSEINSVFSEENGYCEETSALSSEENKRKLGDVNNDGDINPLDASLVLQHDAKIIILSAEEDLNYADVNGDGAVNPLDASLILQFDAKIISRF